MKTLIVGVGAMLASLMAVQAQHFDNSSISLNLDSFGYPNSATYGQTFTAPNNYLNDWTFYLKNDGTMYNGGLSSQNFEFFLMAWDGAEATGPVLYQSDIQTIGTSETSYTPFTVDPNAALTVGGDYVMFINESGLNVGTRGEIGQGLNATSPLGGGFVFLNNGDTFSQVTTTPWFTYPGNEAAYTADFSPVPEPATLSLLGLGGLAALSLIRRRK